HLRRTAGLQVPRSSPTCCRHRPADLPAQAPGRGGGGTGLGVRTPGPGRRGPDRYQRLLPEAPRANAGTTERPARHVQRAGSARGGDLQRLPDQLREQLVSITDGAVDAGLTMATAAQEQTGAALAPVTHADEDLWDAAGRSSRVVRLVRAAWPVTPGDRGWPGVPRRPSARALARRLSAACHREPW